MIWWVLSGVILFFVTYVTYVLFFSKDTETNTSLNDFIIETENDGDVATPRDDGLGKYYTNYEDPGRQVLLLYGTEYGFSEEIARKLFDRMAEKESLQSLDVQPRVLHSKYFERLDFSKENVILCVFSTTGDGVPPTDSRPFFDHLDALQSSSPGALSHLCYSVLALGDYNYPHYCRTGKLLDARLSELGGACLYPRVDVDMEDWAAIERWMGGVLEKVGSLDIPVCTDYLDLSRGEEETGVSRTRPFMAPMTVKYNLTASDAPADKETFHAEFDLSGSEITYTSGDALGIYPQNNPPEVLAILNALRADKKTPVPVPQHCYAPRPEEDTINLEQALLCYYDLKTVKPDLVKYLVDQAVDSQQREMGEHLLEGGLSKSNEVLSGYLSEREVVDVLEDFSSAHCRPGDLLAQLRPLQPRYYSIASTPNNAGESVCVCVAVVRYRLRDRPRTGVCTTYLQDRMEVGGVCPVFISSNPDFRLPTDTSLPIVMIGPGTGIAPFRAFIQERVLSGASGANLLYFGCRHKTKDFLYRSELEKWEEEGVLKLRAAFSRDQSHKVYVQHLIVEDRQLLWKLLQDGAHVYVCGDAVSMAGDVHEELLSMLQQEGGGAGGGMQLRDGKETMQPGQGLSRTEAEEFMEKLEKAGRYQRDVWVT